MTEERETKIKKPSVYITGEKHRIIIGRGGTTPN